VTSDGKQSVDAREFRRLYGQACEATRSHRNLQSLRKHGKFTREATRAVEALQQFTHGTRAALPTAEALERDGGRGLAQDRSRWTTPEASGEKD
jgi:hypothetical protein